MLFAMPTFEENPINMEQESEAATQNQHLYSNPVIESILNLNGGTTYAIHGQSLHAFYVSSVHVSDRHQNKYKYYSSTVFLETRASRSS